MAFDEQLAERIRDTFGDRVDIDERKMFGGLAFMVAGHMCCGVIGDDLMVRVGPEGTAGALEDPHARPMDFTGRPLKGFVYVAPEGATTRQDLAGWVDRALEFVATLPPKG